MMAAWFKFFPTEFLSDSKVRLLSREDRSILIELWCYCAKDGSIPADPELLARLLWESPESTRSAMVRLAHFFQREGDVLISPRLKAECESYEAKCQKLRESAAEGGRKRQANAQANASGNVQANVQAKSAEAEAEAEAEKDNYYNNVVLSTPPSLPPAAPAAVVEAAAIQPEKPKPEKPKRSNKRSQALGIAMLNMPGEMSEAFQRVCDAWPKEGWNFQTRSAGPRKTNLALAAERFKAICEHAPIKTDTGPLTAEDLADATLAWLSVRKREAGSAGVPNVPCIENFFSADPASKKHWQNALLDFFGVAG